MRIIKTAIKLAVLAVAANVTWHFYLAYSAHYKLRDTARYLAQNRGDKTDAQIHDELVQVAEDAEVPIAPEAIEVTHVGLTTSVSASYTRPLEIVPNRTIDWSFSFRVDAYALQSPNTLALPK